jgi:hypothetical protein
MNLIYNPTARRFEAVFEGNFQDDLAAVKGAGFKPDTSTGSWVWHTNKIPNLNRLREKKPASGLTIDVAALDVYKQQADAWSQQEIVRKQLADFRKKAKKAFKVAQETAATPHAEGDCPMDGSLPPCIFEGKELKPTEYTKFVPPVHEGPFCINCKQPVYFYEIQKPFAICIWCEKSLGIQSAQSA